MGVLYLMVILCGIVAFFLAVKIAIGIKNKELKKYEIVFYTVMLVLSICTCIILCKCIEFQFDTTYKLK